MADFKEEGVVGFDLVTEVPDGGLDVESGLQPVDVVDEGVLGAEGADPTLTAVAVGTQPFLKDCEGELVVVG